MDCRGTPSGGSSFSYLGRPRTRFFPRSGRIRGEPRLFFVWFSRFSVGKDFDLIGAFRGSFSRRSRGGGKKLPGTCFKRTIGLDFLCPKNRAVTGLSFFH